MHWLLQRRVILIDYLVTADKLGEDLAPQLNCPITTIHIYLDDDEYVHC